MIRTFVLTFLIFNFVHANMVNCDFQEQFVLGNQNLFVEDLAIEICSQEEYLEDPIKLCQCAKKNQKIIGPFTEDLKVVREENLKDNLNILEQKIYKHVLNSINEFTAIDSKYQLGDAAKKCSLKLIENIQCSSDDSIMGYLKENNSSLLNNIIQNGRCEIESQYGANACSNNAQRISKNNSNTCIPENFAKKLNLDLFEKDFYLFVAELKKNSLESTETFKTDKHPLAKMIQNDEKLKKMFLDKIGNIELTQQNNTQILNILNDPIIQKEFDAKISDGCTKRLEAIKNTLCLPKEEIFHQSLDQLLVNLKTVQEVDDVKKAKRENFLDYQHQVSFNCQLPKVTGVKNSLDKIEENLDVTYKADIESILANSQQSTHEISEKFCSLLSSNKSNQPIDKYYQDFPCPADKQECQMLFSYMQFLSESNPTKTESGNYIYASSQQLSNQMLALYGADETKIVQNIKPVTATMSSPNLKKIVSTQVIKKTKTANSIHTPQDNPAQTTTMIQNNFVPNNQPVYVPKNQPIKTKSNSGNNKISNNPSYADEEIVDEQEQNTQEQTKKKNKQFVNSSNSSDSDESTKDKMIDTLQDQVKRMQEIANKAIDMNYRIPSSNNTDVIQVGENKNAPIKINPNTNNSDYIEPNIGSGGVIDDVSRSSVIPDKNLPSNNNGMIAQNNNTAPAFLQVNNKADKEKSEQVDILEVFFKPGQRPELDLLTESDYKTIVNYLKDQKTFILKKKFNLNGIEEEISAKIIPTRDGKFSIQIVNKNTPKEQLKNLEKELKAALKLAASKPKRKVQQV